jgi:hypothetical protein
MRKGCPVLPPQTSRSSAYPTRSSPPACRLLGCCTDSPSRSRRRMGATAGAEETAVFEDPRPLAVARCKCARIGTFTRRPQQVIHRNERVSLQRMSAQSWQGKVEGGKEGIRALVVKPKSEGGGSSARVSSLQQGVSRSYIEDSETKHVLSGSTQVEGEVEAQQAAPIHASSLHNVHKQMYHKSIQQDCSMFWPLRYC